MAAAADNAQTREVISVSRKDLPLACPPLGDLSLIHISEPTRPY